MVLIFGDLYQQGGWRMSKNLRLSRAEMVNLVSNLELGENTPHLARLRDLPHCVFKSLASFIFGFYATLKHCSVNTFRQNIRAVGFLLAPFLVWYILYFYLFETWSLSWKLGVSLFIFAFPAIIQFFLYLGYILFDRAHVLLSSNKKVLLVVKTRGKEWEIEDLGASPFGGRGSGEVFELLKGFLTGKLVKHLCENQIQLRADATNSYLAGRYVKMGFKQGEKNWLGMVEVRWSCPKVDADQAKR